MKNRCLAILLLLFVFSASIVGQPSRMTNIRTYKITMKLDTISRRIAIRNEIDVEKVDTNRNPRLFLSSFIQIDSAIVNGRKLYLSRVGDTLCLHIGILKKSKLTFWYSIPIDSFIWAPLKTTFFDARFDTNI